MSTSSSPIGCLGPVASLSGTGTLVATYRFTARGLSLAAPVEAISGSGGCRVVLGAIESSSQDLRLTVTVEAAQESDALQQAQIVVNAVYSRILLMLAEHIALSSRPTLENVGFRPDGNCSVAVGRAMGRSEVIGVAQAILSPQLLLPALNCALLEVGAGQPATSGDADLAREMFLVAVETRDPVASYLIYYSALMLATLVANGSNRKKASQAAVENALVKEGILKQPPINEKGEEETPYTRARNEFVHAEDHGGDLAAAMDEIRKLLPTFRKLTAMILSKLGDLKPALPRRV